MGRFEEGAVHINEAAIHRRFTGCITTRSGQVNCGRSRVQPSGNAGLELVGSQGPQGNGETLGTNLCPTHTAYQMRKHMTRRRDTSYILMYIGNPLNQQRGTSLAASVTMEQMRSRGHRLSVPADCQG
jgi:hypothetical protein